MQYETQPELDALQTDATKAHQPRSAQYGRAHKKQIPTSLLSKGPDTMNFNYISFTIGVVLAGITAGSSQPVVQFATSGYAVVEWAGSVTLSVRRFQDLTSVASVDYATVDGTATAGRRFTATNGTVTFAPGETNKSIAVPILNDGYAGGVTMFTVTLRNPTNAVLGAPATATVSISDTDFGIQFQFPSYNPSTLWTWTEDVGVVQIGVVRGDDAADVPVTVDFATSDLDAVSGVDYIGFTNTLLFAPTERLKFVLVTNLNNTLRQPNRTFKATLSNPVGVSLGTTRSTTVTLLDNDGGFQFETNRYNVAEDAGVALIRVLRGTDDTNSTFTVDYATSDVSATNGMDYIGVINTLSFAPGETVKQIAVPILNNGIKQATRSFGLALSNPTGGAVLGAPATTTVFVWDNDPGVGFEAAAYTNSWNPSGDFSVTVLRGNDWFLSPITVDYATSDLTATNGVDYQAVSGTLEFKENETVKSLFIPILRPRAAGSGATFRVILSNPTPGVTLGTATTTVRILGTHVMVAPPFDTALTIWRESGVNVLKWSGGGTLQRADSPTGPWQTLAAAKSPWAIQSPIPRAFYRVARPRLANLYIPSSYTGQTNMPLVIMLHYAFTTGSGDEDYFKITPLAEAKGFLYCYPDATLNKNGARFWSIVDFYNSGVDDAGYLRALIQEIERQFTVDRKRVHLVGNIVGGHMAYGMACQSADLIAGIAAILGVTFLDPGLCQPSEPVNILSIRGTADSILSYDGGATGYFAWPSLFPANCPAYPGALRTVQIWAGYNGARDPVTDSAASMDLVPYMAGLDTVVMRYTSTPPGGAVELWSIIGGQHLVDYSPGFSSRVIDWLLAHPKP